MTEFQCKRVGDDDGPKQQLAEDCRLLKIAVTAIALKWNPCNASLRILDMIGRV